MLRMTEPLEKEAKLQCLKNSTYYELLSKGFTFQQLSSNCLGESLFVATIENKTVTIRNIDYSRTSERDSEAEIMFKDDLCSYNWMVQSPLYRVTSKESCYIVYEY
jgi:hypothetical protein